MYRQMTYPEQADELRHVISAEHYANQKVGRDASPFRPLATRWKFFQWILQRGISFLERVLGVRLYVENQYRELLLIEPRSRALLTRLLDEGVAAKWVRQTNSPDAPPVEAVIIDVASTVLPDGRRFHMGGSTGNGTGNTMSEAMLPALGELLERYSSAGFTEKHIIHGSYKELRHRGAVDPVKFRFYSDEQIASAAFIKSRVTEETKMGWIEARVLSTRRRVLIPAQLAYIFYETAFPQDPIFWSSTSNGVAAGSSYEHAAYGAISESIERDSFMMFWLNKISPPRINLESIPIPAVRDVFGKMRAYGIRVEILDCTTEISVPSFVTMLVDEKSDHPVSVSAGAGFDVEHVLQKLIHESVKFLHAGWPRGTPVSPERIVGIEDRQKYWAQPSMIKEVEFMLQGPVKLYGDIPQTNIGITYAEKLAYMKQVLTTAGFSCYLVDITTRVAQGAGLSVVRAVIPELVPIHFNESRKHLGVARLYTVPKMLGYNGAENEQNFNAVPHPFL
jgi:ribosomal protein S12 methylthiotransferase accessory factor